MTNQRRARIVNVHFLHFPELSDFLREVSIPIKRMTPVEVSQATLECLKKFRQKIYLNCFLHKNEAAFKPPISHRHISKSVKVRKRKPNKMEQQLTAAHFWWRKTYRVEFQTAEM